MANLTKTPSLNVDTHRSPHPFLNPTHLSLSHTTNPNQKVEWQSRKARKGRYAPKSHQVHDRRESEYYKREGQRESGHIAHRETVYMRVKDVESEFKPHLDADVSFWIAVIFTFGSAVWVVNGFLVFLPILYPDLDTTPNSLTAAATAFIGGTTFEVGSYLMVVEALDRGRETNFGTALGRLLHHRRRLPQKAASTNTARNASQFMSTDESSPTRSLSSSATQIGGPSVSPEKDDSKTDDSEWPAGAKGFVWWGKPLWHDMGYLAAIVQMFAATIFWVSTITGLPGVIPGFSDDEGSVAIVDVFFWTPQVIGGTGFIISSLILMVEVQKKWYLPNLTDIGWHVGFWNLVGAVGFMLCGAFGYSPTSEMVEDSAIQTFYGSFAFLIGSICQLYEVIWREPPKKEQSGSSSK